MKAKSVRYAAGAALGLGPVMAFTTPVEAAPQTAAIPPPHAAPAAGKAIKHVKPDAACVGHTEWFFQHSGTFGGGKLSQGLTFWYGNYGTHSQCIGTVEASLNTTGIQLQKPRAAWIIAYTGGTIWSSRLETEGPGGTLPGGPDWVFTTVFRSTIPDPVTVCARWLSRANGDVMGTPVCGTVG